MLGKETNHRLSNSKRTEKHHTCSPYGMCSILQGFVLRFNPVNPTVIFDMQMSKLSTWSKLMMIKKTVVHNLLSFCHLINSLYFLVSKRHFSLIPKTSSIRWLFAMKSSRTFYNVNIKITFILLVIFQDEHFLDRSNFGLLAHSCIIKLH